LPTAIFLMSLVLISAGERTVSVALAQLVNRKAPINKMYKV